MGNMLGIFVEPQHALSLAVTYSRHIIMYIFLVVTTISSTKLLLLLLLFTAIEFSLGGSSPYTSNK